MMPHRPSVSVIIAAYNSEKYIEACIRSVISQNYANIEIIVVNDGSNDGTRTVIDRLSQSDRRIISIDKPKNEGLALARKSGFTRSTGTYIQHLDADDTLTEGAIERLVNRAEETDADIVAASFWFRYPGKAPEPSEELRFDTLTGVEYYREILTEHAYWSVWSNFHKKSLADDPSIVLFPQISMMEDALLMTQLILKADKIAALHHPVLNYNRHDSAMTAHMDRSKYEQIEFAESWLEKYITEKGLKKELGRGLAQRQLRIAFNTIYWHQSQAVEQSMDRTVQNLDTYPDLLTLLTRKEKMILHYYRISPFIVKTGILYHKIRNEINKLIRG